MITKTKEFLQSNNYMQKLSAFFDSVLYPILICSIIFLAYISKLEVIGACLIVLIVSVGLIVKNDLSVLFPALLGFVFIIPYRGNFVKNEFSYPKYFASHLPTIIILATLLITAFTFHFILWGGFRQILSKPSKLFYISLPLTLFFCINGFTNPDYTAKNFIMGILTSFSLLWLNIIFVNNLKYNDKTIKAFCNACTCIAVLLVFEFIFALLTLPIIQNGKIAKYEIFLGWGTTNNFGNICVLVLPAIFYMAYSSNKKWQSVLYFLLGILSYVTACLTMSRNALLTGTMIVGFSLIFLSIKGENKLLFRKILTTLIICAFAVIIVGVILILTKTIEFHLFDDLINFGFSDNGRFKIWNDAILAFLQYPLFGEGFFACSFTSATGFMPGFYHNTIIHLLASCGAITLILYIVYRVQTIKIILHKINAEKIFLGLMILVVIFSSLLDNFIFQFYPTFFYSIALALCELHAKKETIKGK